MAHLGVHIVLIVLASAVSALPAPKPDASLKAYPFLLNQYKVLPVIPPDSLFLTPYNDALANMWRQAPTAEPTSPNQIPIQKGIFQNFINAFAQSLQEIVNRQQSLLDLIYCRTCDNNGSPWQGFLTAMANIPTLGWIMRPNSENGGPAGTFIAATNINGVVTGVGGSIVSNEPVVEYTFNNNQVTPIKPNSPNPMKPTKPVKPKPVKNDILEMPVEKPGYDAEEEEEEEITKIVETE